MKRLCIIIILFGIELNAKTDHLSVTRIAKVPAKALYITQPEKETDRLFVVNQKGLIHIIKDGEVPKTPF